ncbi:hypothetical protein PAXRUDRAFT_822635, partial [Paxillus rubicundulus Ve08.2h10]
MHLCTGHSAVFHLYSMLYAGQELHTYMLMVTERVVGISDTVDRVDNLAHICSSFSATGLI